MFCNSEKLNTIDPQTHTTTTTKRILLCIDTNFALFSSYQSSTIHFSDLLNHLQRSSCTSWNALESNVQLYSSIQHPNMYSSPIIKYNQRNIPVIMCPDTVFILWHLKMTPIFIWQCHMQIPFMLLATLEFHKLGMYLKQIACFMTIHSNITLK